MSEAFIRELIIRSALFHRIIYICMMIYVIFLHASNALGSYWPIVYYLLATLICGINNEIFVYLFRVGRKRNPSVKICGEMLILAAGAFVPGGKEILFFPYLLFVVVLIAEDTIFNNIYDHYNILFRRIIYLLILIAEISGIFFISGNRSWIISDLSLCLVCIVIIYYVFYLFNESYMEMDRKATELFFEKITLDEDNKKLIVFQDKVKNVNSEINFQKINLMKANADLENMNNEVRSLIEVMKGFASSFDVKSNCRIMLENIMKVKKTAMCGIYINKGVFNNKKPYVDILSLDDEKYKNILEGAFEDIFMKVREQKSAEPIVICKNMEVLHDFFKGKVVCNAVAFPAYENEHFYGVLVVASGKYDFFESGYSFYESSLMDFTTALRSDRLFLAMEDMARKDGLTQIYNRSYFNETYKNILKEVKDSDSSLCVSLLDIDKFKSINDTYGHLAGDEVIKMVAGEVNKFAEEYNGIAVRYGGEEFLLILPGKTLNQALKVLKAVHKEIRENVVKYEEYEIHVNTSLGIASYPDTTKKIEEVLDRADRAMYYSKEHGRGYIIIDGREEESYNTITDDK